MKRRSATAFYRAMNRMPRHTAPVAAPPTFNCPGCQWTFKDAAALAAHKEKCDAAKAQALPQDDDADGWRALAERMKRAAVEAQSKGRIDEYEAHMRRSDAAAEKARAAGEKKGAA